MSTKFSNPQPQSQLQPNVARVQYRRAAEAISMHEQQTAMSKSSSTTRRPNTHRSHRVVAHPMDPISPVATSSQVPPQPYLDSPAQQQQHQPTLYDTSVSSATLTNSAEDGRSTGSSGGNHYRLSQRSQKPAHSLYESTISKRYSPRSDNRYSGREMDVTDTTYITQSEPGVSVEHDRFAAYINRFAELDPRMDHRLAVEEKKMDDHDRLQQPLPIEQSDSAQQKKRFRNRSGYAQNLTHSTVVPTSHSQEEYLPPSTRRGLRSTQTEEAMSDIVTNSPSSRTRDLARRIEQHMGRKQQLQQQQREATHIHDVAPSHPSATVSTRVSFEEPVQNQTTTRNPDPYTKPNTQPHFYYPQSQLGATYVPIPTPQQRMELSAYQNYAPVETEPISSPRYEKRASSQKVSPPQNDVVSRRMDVSNAPSYPQRSQERTMESIPALTQTNSNTSARSKQAIQQQQLPQQQLEPDIHRTEHGRTSAKYDQSTRPNIHTSQQDLAVHNQPQVTQQRTSRRHEQSQQEQPRSRSLGPPQRRRQQSVREFVPIQQYSSPNDYNVNGEVVDPTNESSPNEPLIRRLGNRAEIETPLPANVRELRRMLWTEDELLQVKSRASYRDVEINDGKHYGQKTHIGGPEMAGTSGQRNTRSLSPKTHRIRNNNEDSNHGKYGVSAREQKGMLFKSRYYEAALRGEMSTSPKRENAITAAESGENYNKTAPTTKSFDSVTPIKQQKSNSPSDIRSGSTEDIDTTLAIEPDMTNSSSTRQATNMRNMEHRNQLGSTDATMKEDYAMYLLRKINQVNKDDPQAALAEINALLRQQPTITAMPAETISKNNVQCIDDPVMRETSSVPGVEQARPMEGDNESDDESDGTSVSSMTNPTFLDTSHKDSVPISPSGGRPRPSLLGSYNNPSPKFSSTNRITTESRPPHIAKEEQNAATESDQQTNPNAVGKRDTEFQRAGDNTIAKSKVSDMALDNSKTDALEKKSTPSLLSQLGSLIAPRRLEDLHSKELSEKIKQWDELSTGAIPVETSTAGASKAKGSTLDTKTSVAMSEFKRDSKVSERRDVSPGSALKRDHPWDAAIPVRMGQINTKDTSMDCGDGIEAEFTPKYSKAQVSSRFSDVSPPVRKHSDSPVQPTNTTNKVVDQKKDAPRFVSNQHQQAKAMSDDFDSAWVSLPSSTFFGSKQSTGHSNRNNVGAANQRSNIPTTIQHEEQGEELLSTNAADDVEVEYVHNSTRIRSTEVQTIAPEESNRSYAQLKSPKRDVYPRHRKSSTFDDSYEENPNQSVVNTSKSFETAPVTGDESKPRGRGLRGFLKRKQAEKAQAGSSVDRTSATVVSRRSAATTTAATRPLGELADIEATPSNGNYSELVNRYSRRSAKSRSPSRTRSRSVDERRTTRTPSLARKFNRLLRVYDHDNTELTEV